MKWAFVADVHIGNHTLFSGKTVAGINERAQLIINFLHQAVRNASTQCCTHFCILGDLFDGAKPSPRLLEMTMDVLNLFDGRVVVVRGNHDMTSEAEDALGVLKYVPELEVVRYPMVVDGFLCVPYQSMRPMQDEILEALKDNRNVWGVGFHAGVRDPKRTPPWLMNAADSVDAKQLMRMMHGCSVPVAFAGNWHDRCSWSSNGCSITQCGALVPTGFDNDYGPGGTGMVSIYTLPTTANQHVLLGVDINAPLFKKIVWSEAGGVPDAVSNDFVRFVVRPGEIDAVRAALKLGGFQCRGYDFQIDRTEAKEAAQIAARSASAAGGFGPAVDAYVEKMPLDAGVDRTQVLAEVRRLAKLGDQ